MSSDISFHDYLVETVKVMNYHSLAASLGLTGEPSERDESSHYFYSFVQKDAKNNISRLRQHYSAIQSTMKELGTNELSVLSSLVLSGIKTLAAVKLLNELVNDSVEAVGKNDYNKVAAIAYSVGQNHLIQQVTASNMIWLVLERLVSNPRIANIKDVDQLVWVKAFFDSLAEADYDLAKRALDDAQQSGENESANVYRFTFDTQEGEKNVSLLELRWPGFSDLRLERKEPSDKKELAELVNVISPQISTRYFYFLNGYGD